MRWPVITLPFFLLFSMIFFSVSPAWTAVLRVENNGVDSPSCGSKSDPCRSISQAIDSASDGDQIIVGPGLYGDLDGSGTSGDSAGEEHAPAACNCMILIDKSVVIVSHLGAETTVLDGGGFACCGVNAVVRIEADGTTFGRKWRGFTVTGVGAFLGVLVTASAPNVTVSGNRAVNLRQSGFSTESDNVRLVDNIASGIGAQGFVVSGDNTWVHGNAASGNGGPGFIIFGSGHHVAGNIANANAYSGYEIGGSFTFTTNYSVGNGQNGLRLESSSLATIRHNAILGNKGPGISLIPIANAIVEWNNVYGNDASGDNCGMINRSSTPVTVGNNFWGAATGPGADPADTVCAEPGAAAIIVNEFATTQFNIPPPGH